MAAVPGVQGGDRGSSLLRRRRPVAPSAHDLGLFPAPPAPQAEHPHPFGCRGQCQAGLCPPHTVPGQQARPRRRARGVQSLGPQPDPVVRG